MAMGSGSFGITEKWNFGSSVGFSISHGAGGAVVGIGRGVGCGKAPHLINTISKGLIYPKTSQCLSGARAIPSLLPGLRNLFLRLVMSTT